MDSGKILNNFQLSIVDLENIGWAFSPTKFVFQTNAHACCIRLVCNSNNKLNLPALIEGE